MIDSSDLIDSNKKDKPTGFVLTTDEPTADKCNHHVSTKKVSIPAAVPS